MIRVTTEWAGGQGVPWYSTHHFAGVTEDAAVDAVSAVAGFWGDVDANQPNTINWRVSGEVPVVNPATGQITELFTVTGATGAGAGSGETVPWADQALIRWTTGFYQNGRQVRGRTFIPGLVIAASDAGRVAPITVTNLATAAADFLADLQPGNELVIYSRTAGTATAVTGASVWANFAVLRSRRD